MADRIHSVNGDPAALGKDGIPKLLKRNIQASSASNTLIETLHFSSASGLASKQSTRVLERPRLDLISRLIKAGIWTSKGLDLTLFLI